MRKAPERHRIVGHCVRDNYDVVVIDGLVYAIESDRTIRCILSKCWFGFCKWARETPLAERAIRVFHIDGE